MKKRKARKVAVFLIVLCVAAGAVFFGFQKT